MRVFVFCFKQKTAYEMRISDWSSDVCSSDLHRSGIILAPTLDYMDRAFLDAKQFGWSKAPIVEMLIPSVVDDSLAPPGQHVASLFCQQFAPELPDGDRKSVV